MTLVAALCGSVWERAATAAPLGLIVFEERAPFSPVSQPALSRALTAAAALAGTEVVAEPFARARDRLRRGAAPAERSRRLSQAVALGKEGWNAYLAAEPEVSAARLAEALLVAAEVVDMDEGRGQGIQVYADLLLYYGAVLLKLGQVAAAEDALALAHTLVPGREVSIRSFAPDVVEAYERAAGRQAVPVRMRVRAEPPAAEVVIDGRSVGRAPADITVARGRHLVVVRAEGYTPHAQMVLASEEMGADGPSIAVELRPDPMAAAVMSGPAALAIGQSSASVRLTLSAVIDYGELGGLVLAAGIWRRGAPALLGQRCDGVPVRCTAVVEIGYPGPEHMPAAAASLWHALDEAPRAQDPTFLGDERLVHPEAAPRAERVQPAGKRADAGGLRCRMCQNPWLWLGVGAAVAVVGSSVWLATRDHAGPTTVVIDPCEFGQCAP